MTTDNQAAAVDLVHRQCGLTLQHAFSYYARPLDDDRHVHLKLVVSMFGWMYKVHGTLDADLIASLPDPFAREEYVDKRLCELAGEIGKQLFIVGHYQPRDFVR